jgi:hypothetical protein
MTCKVGYILSESSGGWCDVNTSSTGTPTDFDALDLFLRCLALVLGTSFLVCVCCAYLFREAAITRERARVAGRPTPPRTVCGWSRAAFVFVSTNMCLFTFVFLIFGVAESTVATKHLWPSTTSVAQLDHVLFHRNLGLGARYVLFCVFWLVAIFLARLAVMARAEALASQARLDDAPAPSAKDDRGACSSCEYYRPYAYWMYVGSASLSGAIICYDIAYSLHSLTVILTAANRSLGDALFLWLLMPIALSHLFVSAVIVTMATSRSSGRRHRRVSKISGCCACLFGIGFVLWSLVSFGLAMVSLALWWVALDYLVFIGCAIAAAICLLAFVAMEICPVASAEVNNHRRDTTGDQGDEEKGEEVIVEVQEVQEGKVKEEPGTRVAEVELGVCRRAIFSM